MLIYRLQENLDFYLLIMGAMFLIIGIVLFFKISKIQIIEKEDFFTRSLGLNKFDLIERSKESGKISKLIGLIFMVAAVSILMKTLGNQIYVNYVEYFRDIKTISGHIDHIHEYEQLGRGLILVGVKRNSFMILETNYISNRRALQGDSVEISYYENPRNLKVVVEIKLVK